MPGPAQSPPAAEEASGPALMTGAPPFPEQSRVTLANWQDPPFNRWAFQHIREADPHGQDRSRAGGGLAVAARGTRRPGSPLPVRGPRAERG